MTKQLSADHDQKNDERAKSAEQAVSVFQAQTGSDRQDALADLLCDLIHWADRNGQDFDAELRRAFCHYEAETDQ